MLPLNYIGIGLIAGVCSGIFGVGGGIIIVPILVLLFGFTQHAANGTSLVALLAPVGILGVVQYFRAGKITKENIVTGLWIAMGMFLGAYVGAKIAVHLSDNLLRKAFALFLIGVSIRMWFW